jgi:uncharacterized protein with FMN-binding domain
MRRSVAAVALTVVGLWLILTFKSSPVLRANTTVPGTATVPTSTVPSGPTTTSSPPATGPPGPGSTTTQTSASAQRTVTGNVFANRYGDVQVAVVLNGNQIVNIKALQMPHDRSRSADISSQAAPLLHDEVIQAQSAQIDTIGGATYTSESYAQSLQSALDKARG